MAANILEIAGYVRDSIQAILDAAGDTETTVTKRWAKRVDKELDTITGRHVDVWHVGYSDDGPADRETAFKTCTVIVTCFERYAEAGEVPDEWVETLVNFVEQKLFVPLSKAEENVDEGEPVVLRFGGEWWCSTGEVVTVCDADLLRSHKTFYSELRLSYTRTQE